MGMSILAIPIGSWLQRIHVLDLFQFRKVSLIPEEITLLYRE